MGLLLLYIAVINIIIGKIEIQHRKASKVLEVLIVYRPVKLFR